MTKLIPFLLLFSVSVNALDTDSIPKKKDRRWADTLGRHFIIDYTYELKEIVHVDSTDATGDFAIVHDHFPAHISITEYSGRSRQKVVWEGNGIYSESECSSDNGALWVRRYLKNVK